jgi:hypothetical protein
MSWSTQGTHFGCPVFVVWKNVTDKDGNVSRKGRPVVDLRHVSVLNAECVVVALWKLRQGLHGVARIRALQYSQWRNRIYRFLCEQTRHLRAVYLRRSLPPTPDVCS